MSRTVRGFFSGWGGALAFTTIMQDRYGSLEGYISHLHEPNAWIQIPLWIPICVLIICCGVYFTALIDELKE